MSLSFSNKQQVVDHINAVLVELFELEKEELAPEKNLFEDFDLDSLDAIDMIVRFKKDFDINPPNDDLTAIRTVQDVYSMVDKYYDGQ